MGGAASAASAPSSRSSDVRLCNEVALVSSVAAFQAEDLASSTTTVLVEAKTGWSLSRRTTVACRPSRASRRLASGPPVDVLGAQRTRVGELRRARRARCTEIRRAARREIHLPDLETRFALENPEIRIVPSSVTATPVTDSQCAGRESCIKTNAARRPRCGFETPDLGAVDGDQAALRCRTVVPSAGCSNASALNAAAAL